MDGPLPTFEHIGVFPKPTSNSAVAGCMDGAVPGDTPYYLRRIYDTVSFYGGIR